MGTGYVTRTVSSLAAVALLALAALALAGCGSGSEPLGFSGTWVSTGGEELTLEIGVAKDGEYPVTFSGGGIERTLSATQKDEDTYRAEGETDEWVFRMVDDNMMTVTIIPADGAEVSTSFKRQ